MVVSRGFGLAPDVALAVFAILLTLYFLRGIITVNTPNPGLSAVLTYFALPFSLSQIFETEQSTVNDEK